MTPFPTSISAAGARAGLRWPSAPGRACDSPWRTRPGQTHLAIALGLAACRDGQRTCFYTVTGLVNDLQLAQNQQRLPHFIDQALRHKLIILDELGYIPFSTTGCFNCSSVLFRPA
ncbi:MAG: ATP-binding protein [Caldilineaceae bacterium]